MQCSHIFWWHMALDLQALVVVNCHSALLVGLEHPLGACGLRHWLFTFGKCYAWCGAGRGLLEPDPMACFLPAVAPFVKGFVSAVLLGHFHLHIFLAAFLFFSIFWSPLLARDFSFFPASFWSPSLLARDSFFSSLFLSSSCFLSSSLLARDFFPSSSTLGFFGWGLAATPKLLLMELEVLVLVLLSFSAASCALEGPSSCWQGVAVSAAGAAAAGAAAACAAAAGAAWALAAAKAAWSLAMALALTLSLLLWDTVPTPDGLFLLFLYQLWPSHLSQSAIPFGQGVFQQHP